MCAPLLHSSSEVRLALHVINQVGQVHFCGSRLKAVFHRGLRQLLELICTRALQEEIRIATDVVAARKADRVHPFLDDGVSCCWKSGDPTGQRLNEVTKFSGWQRSIDPAVAFG